MAMRSLWATLSITVVLASTSVTAGPFLAGAPSIKFYESDRAEHHALTIRILDEKNSLTADYTPTHNLFTRVSVQDTTALRTFFGHLERKDAQAALDHKNKMPAGLNREIAAWMIATSSLEEFRPITLRRQQTEVRDWPGQTVIARRVENALTERHKTTPVALLDFLGEPQTLDGKRLWVRSLLAAGHKSQGREFLRKMWVEDRFSASDENKILSEFGSHLRQRDHEERLEGLLYDERVGDAERLLNRVGSKRARLARARIAVIRRAPNAAAELNALSNDLKQDPGAIIAQVQLLRRADRWLDAGQILLTAPRNQDKLIDPSEWWIERRMVSRKVLEAGNPQLAYQIVTENASERIVEKADAAFHAGWYALRFLGRADLALQHFDNLREMTRRPLSQSRAYYWMGRSSLALGRERDARKHFRQAARYPQTYYGQLSLVSLGQRSLGLPQLPETKSVKGSFNNHKFVRVINRLTEIGQSGRTGIFFVHLARTLEDPREITRLAQMAEEKEMHASALQVGRIAVGRGLPVPRLAYPLGALSKSQNLSTHDLALSYAIARQESAFQIDAVSRADARGLMQLLPATARTTARKLGIRYDERRLTRDGAYNARLGTAFLGELMERFGGSYVLAFAGYNAGPGRSDQWIARFGDPRKNSIDAIDWVEAIPFEETRNYVQRVMENFQVYRYRLESPPLAIEQDLNRGKPGS